MVQDLAKLDRFSCPIRLDLAVQFRFTGRVKLISATGATPCLCDYMQLLQTMEALVLFSNMVITIKNISKMRYISNCSGTNWHKFRPGCSQANGRHLGYGCVGCHERSLRWPTGKLHSAKGSGNQWNPKRITLAQICGIPRQLGNTLLHWISLATPTRVQSSSHSVKIPSRWMFHLLQWIKPCGFGNPPLLC